MSTEFEFTIEDNIPYKQKKETVSKPTDKLNDAIYTYANKLNEGQSFFLENKLFLNIKWPNSKINSVLTKLRKFKIYVVGEAKNPGSYEISSTNTLFNVLFMAGGPSDIGSLRNISIIRNNKTIKKIDLYDFILKGDKSNDIKLENGDTVYFNLKGKTVMITIMTGKVSLAGIHIKIMIVITILN